MRAQKCQSPDQRVFTRRGRASRRLLVKKALQKATIDFEFPLESYFPRGSED